MHNIAKVTSGIIAVSRDCFPIELSKKRRKILIQECRENHVNVTEIITIIENEKDVLKAIDEIKEKNINSLIIYLGNFGPEIPTTMLIQKFPGPVMIVAAAEESGKDLIDGRGDAYCGMLNTSYNCGLRRQVPYIPHYPVGTPDEIVPMIENFLVIARILISVKQLKIFSFGPRPQDFVACNAPIKPLYDLGIEIMENSELDLYDIYNSAEGNPAIPGVVEEMKRELGTGNTYPAILPKLAQYEVALVQFLEKNLGASRYGIFANKCWPAFEKYFGFVPCYINSRLASRGIPVSCEVDIYGVLSEYIGYCASGLPSTILDINNTVPYDIIREANEKTKAYQASDMFMGFHCGNTPSCFLINPTINYQLIMHRLMEPDKDPDITRGTLEGRIAPGEITIFRLQSTAETKLMGYAAEGEVLPVEPRSFGGIGVIGIKEMARFYRHVLIEKRYPHHTAVTFRHTGKTLFAALRMLGINDISYNRKKGDLYPSENPFF
ncbi:MAG: fucose isomerase [Spirochaetales bacterium]|nr:fucose isomerase [Spirochaetales bacterium]